MAQSEVSSKDIHSRKDCIIHCDITAVTPRRYRSRQCAARGSYSQLVVGKRLEIAKRVALGDDSRDWGRGAIFTMAATAAHNTDRSGGQTASSSREVQGIRIVRVNQRCRNSAWYTSNDPCKCIAGDAVGFVTLMQVVDEPPFWATALTVGVILSYLRRAP